MKSKKPAWMGSDASQYVASKLRDPNFRIHFAEARAKRIKRALADAMRDARQRLRLTQTLLAKRVKTTQAVISKIENPDESYLPSVEVLSRIAIALGARLELSFVVERNKRAA